MTILISLVHFEHNTTLWSSLFLHRPVFALLEIDVVKVDEKKRNEVREKVMKELGPSDRTVVVTVNDDERNSIDVNELLASLQQYGDIVLVR